MAKAKKSTDQAGTEEIKAAPKKKASAKSATGETAPKGAASKKAPKPASAGTGGFGFGIDTNLAAQSAAKMLMGRSTQGMSSGGGTMKHLKDTMAKPSGSALGNLLGSGGTSGGKASNLPHFSNQQKGHNQATHVGNTGVPRRTPG